MRRALFVGGLALTLGCFGLVAYGAVAGKLTETLLHILAGGAALGAVLAAWMADPERFLALVDRAIAWKKGGAAVIIVALLAIAPGGLSAQSTGAGKILYAPDRWWTSVQAHNPWTRRLDDTEGKSALCTAAVTELGGYAIAKATPMSFRRARQLVASVYVMRAAYGLSAGETRRFRAQAKHVTAAALVATLRVQVRF